MPADDADDEMYDDEEGYAEEEGAYEEPGDNYQGINDEYPEPQDEEDEQAEGQEYSHCCNLHCCRGTGKTTGSRDDEKN